MQKIVPHLWFDKEAAEASKFYTDLFDNSRIETFNKLTGTPSGDCDILTFTLAGEHFMSISAGPYFKFNPSISLFATFETEAELQEAWDALIDGGMAMMELGTYPWAHKYGWLKDRYGLTWQLTSNENYTLEPVIRPAMMFTKEMSGKTREAIEFYTSIFPNSTTDSLVEYEKGEGDTEGFIKHARFTLDGCKFIAMDSSGPHDFRFNEALSFVVNCDSQEQINYYWEKLSAVPEAEQCGWLKDKYGVSWQIVPTLMQDVMNSGDKKKMVRVTEAFMKMKKFDIATLQKAADAE